MPPVEEHFSFKETLIEVRNEVRGLRGDFENFKEDAMAFRASVVLKDELDLWRKSQQTARRWAITTIISLIVVTIMSVTLIIQFQG